MSVTDVNQGPCMKNGLIKVITETRQAYGVAARPLKGTSGAVMMSRVLTAGREGILSCVFDGCTAKPIGAAILMGIIGRVIHGN